MKWNPVVLGFVFPFGCLIGLWLAALRASRQRQRRFRQRLAAQKRLEESLQR
jgi:hypothetical protein